MMAPERVAAWIVITVGNLVLAVPAAFLIRHGIDCLICRWKGHTGVGYCRRCGTTNMWPKRDS